MSKRGKQLSMSVKTKRLLLFSRSRLLLAFGAFLRPSQLEHLVALLKLLNSEQDFIQIYVITDENFVRNDQKCRVNRRHRHACRIFQKNIQACLTCALYKFDQGLMNRLNAQHQNFEQVFSDCQSRIQLKFYMTQQKNLKLKPFLLSHVENFVDLLQNVLVEFTESVTVISIDEYSSLGRKN